MSAPPSYDSIVSKLKNLVGPNPTPRRFLDAASTLSSTEIDILTQNAHTKASENWTPTQQAQFTLGMVKEMGSDEAGVHLIEAADAGAAACITTDAMFRTLRVELSDIELKYSNTIRGPFYSNMVFIHQSFQTYVCNSERLAVKIATYARDFDKIIIPLCINPSITVHERLNKIKAFIADAEAFAVEANALIERFNTLKGDFALLVGSFASWAVDREIADTAQLKQARQDLEALNKKLSDLQVSLAAVSSATAAVLPVTGVLALFAGIFAPFVIIGGLIAAAVGVGSTVGLAVSIQNTQSDIAAKKKQIDTLAQGIDDIKATRENLTRMGDAYLLTFSGNIDILTIIWQNSHNDAIRVQHWLEGGAKDVDMPEYMQISVNNAVTIYALMADYLERYASSLLKDFQCPPIHPRNE